MPGSLQIANVATDSFVCFFNLGNTCNSKNALNKYECI